MLENPFGFTTLPHPSSPSSSSPPFLAVRWREKEGNFPLKRTWSKPLTGPIQGRYIINTFFFTSTIQNFPKIFFKKRLVKTPHRAYSGRYIINRFFFTFSALKTAFIQGAKNFCIYVTIDSLDGQIICYTTAPRKFA